MENDKDEIIDSTNDTEDTEKVNEDEVADTESEETEEKDKPKYTDNEKKLYARAKKAEAAEKLAKEELANLSKITSGKPAPTSDIDKLLDAKLEKRDLDALDLSDELRKEVSTYAKVQGVSVKKALNSEYISFLKDKEDKKEKIDNASLGSKRRASSKKDYSEMKPSDFDLKTPEGKADFAKYEEHLRTQLG